MRRRSPAPAVVAAALLGILAGPAPADPAPTLVAVLLDSSGSIPPPELARARRLAGEVLGRLPSGSEVAVFTFDDQSRLVLPRTSNAQDVERALSAVRTSGRHTALYDGLYDASRYLRESGAARSAILLITDGKDEQSALNLDDGLRLAQDGRIPVFAVGVGQVEERGLRRIAKLTGGEYHAARDADGAAIVSAILAAPAPEGRAAAAASAQVATAPTGSRAPAPPKAAEPPPPPEPQGSRTLRLLRIPAALAVLAAVTFGFFALRKPGPRCRTCRRALPDALSTCAFCAERGDPPSPPPPESTVVSRLGSTTEEYLEKTVVLREKAVLAVTRGPLAGQVFDLSAVSATSLGRSKANDLVLDDVSVSSQHCRIRPDEGGFTLLDLKSTNGTFVNERRVTTHKLAEGDVIRLGEMQLQFRLDQRRG
jgi:hypothetical protein